MLESNLRLRSFMYLPAHNKRFIDKAIVSCADGLILDLEDGVPASKRKEARDNIRAYCANGLFASRKNVFVRINPIDSEEFVDDISELIVEGIDGFMLSKINDAEDIIFVDKLLTFWERKNGIAKNKYKLAPLIETTKSVENITLIASASSRLIALCLGGEDYLNDLGSVYTYQQSALAFPRAALVNAARANGLLPIDTPFLDIKNTKGFRDIAKEAYKDGFAGTLILNPVQIEPANEAFSPDEDIVVRSRRIIKAVEEANISGQSGVAMLDGAMVGPPMRKRAENVLKQIGEDI